jgi:uncharacterized protein (TIGR02611 family)
MQWLFHNAKRIARIVAGVVVLIAGIIMAIPGVPGPGLLTIFLGLSILAVDFVWAHQLKTKIEQKTKDAINKLRGKKTE